MQSCRTNKKAVSYTHLVGDDGVDGLAIGPEVPEGQVYAEFQSYCKALKSIGVIQMCIRDREKSGKIKQNSIDRLAASWYI